MKHCIQFTTFDSTSNRKVDDKVVPGTCVSEHGEEAVNFGRVDGQQVARHLELAAHQRLLRLVAPHVVHDPPEALQRLGAPRSLLPLVACSIVTSFVM